MIPYNQLSLADIFPDCQKIYESDKPQFLSLLQQHIDLAEIVPSSFRKHFYAPTGRSHKYSLNAFLWTLIIQRIFSIPTDSLLLVFLHYPRHLREFCGFDRVPGASKITCFKQDFLEDLQTLFHRLVNLTEPLCQAINSSRTAMTIFDSSGIESGLRKIIPSMPIVLSNTSKHMPKPCTLIPNYDTYKAAYVSMPSNASTNHKFGIATNGLGIVRLIIFYNRDFFDKHPEIIINKKSDSPEKYQQAPQ